MIGASDRFHHLSSREGLADSADKYTHQIVVTHGVDTTWATTTFHAYCSNVHSTSFDSHFEFDCRVRKIKPKKIQRKSNQIILEDFRPILARDHYHQCSNFVIVPEEPAN